MAKKQHDPNFGLAAPHPDYQPTKINNFIKQHVKPKPERHEFEAARATGATTNQAIVDAILDARRKSATATAATAAPVTATASEPPPWLRDGFVMLPIRAYQELLAAAGR